MYRLSLSIHLVIHETKFYMHVYLRQQHRINVQNCFAQKRIHETDTYMYKHYMRQAKGVFNGELSLIVCSLILGQQES